MMLAAGRASWLLGENYWFGSLLWSWDKFYIDEVQVSRFTREKKPIVLEAENIAFEETIEKSFL